MLNSKIFNDMGFGLVQLSTDGEIIDANSVALNFFETDFKSIKSRKFSELTSSKKVVGRNIDAANDEGVSEVRFQTAIILPNGRKKQCRISIKPEFKDGKLSYVLAAIHEIKAKSRISWKNLISFSMSLVLSILIIGQVYLDGLHEFLT